MLLDGGAWAVRVGVEIEQALRQVGISQPFIFQEAGDHPSVIPIGDQAVDIIPVTRKDAFQGREKSKGPDVFNELHHGLTGFGLLVVEVSMQVLEHAAGSPGSRHHFGDVVIHSLPV